MTKEKTTISLHYKSLKILNFSQYDVDYFEVGEKNSIEYLSEFQGNIRTEEKELIITTSIKIRVVKTDQIFCELKISSTFTIEPFDTIIINKEDKNITIPRDLLNLTSDVIMHTVRGILHEKLKGTILQNEVLPLVQTTDIVQIK